MKLPFKLVYHEGYDLHFGDHVFPSQKYRLIRRRLINAGLAGPSDFLTPAPATRHQLLLVHTPQWVKKLETGTLTYHDILKLEVPYSRKMVDAYLLSAGGTILAARQALRSGVGYNIGGGFHHAFPNHGEGFCAVNDVAVAVRTLQHEGVIKTALVESVGQSKAPGSTVAGRANTLIFPDVGSANIGVKLVERLGGAICTGPLFQGFLKPANDLSRGCTAEDIYRLGILTALQAGA